MASTSNSGVPFQTLTRNASRRVASGVMAYAAPTVEPSTRSRRGPSNSSTVQRHASRNVQTPERSSQADETVHDDEDPFTDTRPVGSFEGFSAHHDMEEGSNQTSTEQFDALYEGITHDSDIKVDTDIPLSSYPVDSLGNPLSPSMQRRQLMILTGNDIPLAYPFTARPSGSILRLPQTPMSSYRLSPLTNPAAERRDSDLTNAPDTATPNFDSTFREMYPNEDLEPAYLRSDSPIRQNRSACISPICPITEPHVEGVYLHEGKAPPGDPNNHFGRSNPPPEIWQAWERLANLDDSEQWSCAQDLVRRFMEFHAE